MIGLVDCNSFYCSCERVFAPKTRGRPVIVLSNNDGCAIAFSKEAKLIGLGQMCEPLFQIQEKIKKHNVVVFSSNYSLYDDMSKRVMSILANYTHELEVYSVDEAFLNFDGRHEDLFNIGQEIRKEILRCTGIPVGVGISTTKVLSKVANRLSKKSNTAILLDNEDKINHALKTFPVGDLWGIGSASARKLSLLGIKTAFEFKNYPNEKIIQKMFTKTGRQIQEELKGIKCLEMKEVEDKKNIATTRSFPTLIYDKKELKEAIANFATKACEKLRFQNSICYEVSIFIMTNVFQEWTEQHHQSVNFYFSNGTSDTFKIINTCNKLLDIIFKENIGYKKAGVILGRIRSGSSEQLNFLNEEPQDNLKLIEAMDKINSKFGPQAIKSGACGTQNKWEPMANHKSKKFTTSWDDLLIAD